MVVTVRITTTHGQVRTMKMSSHRFPPGRLKPLLGTPSLHRKNARIVSPQKLLEFRSVGIPPPFANRHTSCKQSLKASQVGSSATNWVPNLRLGICLFQWG